MNGILPETNNVSDKNSVYSPYRAEAGDDVKIKRLESQKQNYEKKLQDFSGDSSETVKLNEKIISIENQIKKLSSGTDNSESGSESEKDIKRRFDSFECSTCKNRRYQDVSNDSGVSFQSPTKVSPNAAESAVRAHENEHVTRNQAKADREGSRIVSQTVTIKRGICPECGKNIVTGGLTKTTTKAEMPNPMADKFKAGMFDNAQIKGGMFSSVA